MGPIYLPSPRPDALLLDIKFGHVHRRVAIIPSAFGSLQMLLDTLFMHYLSDTVEAYTYGAEWILVGDPFCTRLICPIEWVRTPHVSVTELAPVWAAKTPLDNEGLIPGRYAFICRVDMGYSQTAQN
jgi:hypothetical protein